MSRAADAIQRAGWRRCLKDRSVPKWRTRLTRLKPTLAFSG